jgi:hypothetical protein
MEGAARILTSCKTSSPATVLASAGYTTSSTSWANHAPSGTGSVLTATGDTTGSAVSTTGEEPTGMRLLSWQQIQRKNQGTSGCGHSLRGIQHVLLLMASFLLDWLCHPFCCHIRGLRKKVSAVRKEIFRLHVAQQENTKIRPELVFRLQRAFWLTT